MKKFTPSLLRGNQRITLIGQTGSGKTVLARYLLMQARAKGWRIVIVDPKKDWMNFLGKHYPYAEKGLGTINSPWVVKEFDPHLAVQLFQPLEWDASCEKFFQAIIATKNTIVYIDEITQLATATQVPRELKIIWTQGRAINVGGWCSTQRPKGIPVIVKDQSEVWFLFRVNSRDDREVVTGYIPLDDSPDVVEKPLPKYWFYYWDDTMYKPILVHPLHLERMVA